MTVLPQLEAELLAAHGRLAARRGGPRRWRRAWRGGVAILLASATALAVVALALVLVRHGHATGTHPSAPPPASPSGPPPAPHDRGPAPKPVLPPHPSRTQVREVDYLFHATGTAERLDRACQGTPPAQVRPTLSNGTPNASLLSILGVLRRPARPTDKLPPRVVGLQHTVIPNGSLPPAKDIYTRYIRRARWRFGAGYYLVPAGDVNQNSPIPPRCYAEQRKALERELPHIPRALRAPTLALEPRFIAEWRYSTLPYPGRLPTRAQLDRRRGRRLRVLSDRNRERPHGVDRWTHRGRGGVRTRPRRRRHRHRVLPGALPRPPDHRARDRERVHRPRSPPAFPG